MEGRMGGKDESPQSTHPHVGRVQQQISEGRVVLGGEHVVLGVNNVEAQRAELLHLHRLASVLSGLQVVPAEDPTRILISEIERKNNKYKVVYWDR